MQYQITALAKYKMRQGGLRVSHAEFATDRWLGTGFPGGFRPPRGSGWLWKGPVATHFAVSVAISVEKDVEMSVERSVENGVEKGVEYQGLREPSRRPSLPGELPKSSRIRVNGQSGSRLAGSLYTVPAIQTLLYTESASYCAEWKLRLYTPPPHPSGKPSCSRVTPMLGDQHENRSGQSPLRGLGAVSLGVAPEPEIREAGQDAQPPPLVVQRLPC